MRVREPRPKPMREGVGQWKPGWMITRLMTSECSSKKPVIRARYHPPLRFLSCWSWQAAEAIGVYAVAETMIMAEKTFVLIR